MELTFASSATVAAPEALLMRGGRWRWLNLRVRYGVLRHKSGVWLIDTGIGPLAVPERGLALPAPAPWPGRGLALRAYAAALRYRLDAEQAPQAVLARMGLTAADVTGIIITHFHADHVARLAEFPNARLFAHGPSLASVRAASNRTNLRHGIFAALLPAGIEDRLTCITSLPQRALPYAAGTGADLFDCGTCLAVMLPGHATGHFGLAFPDLSQPLLYACDTQWLLAALPPGQQPGLPARLILDDASAAARSTALVHRWQSLGGEVVLCHDPARSHHDLA